MIPSRHRRTAVLAAALILLTACGSSGDSGTTSTADDDPAAPQSGGTLRYLLSTSPVCPDPQQAGQNQAIYIARQVVDSLTDQDPETGEIVPWLAESWEINDEATEFTFHLRDGVTFSDGTALDAESVRKNLDSIVDDIAASAPLAVTYLSGYVETRVDDELTATVVFDAPNAQFLQATSTFSLGLLADETLAASPEERCLGNVIGSGPFVYESYTQDQEAVLVKRDGYAWGSAVFAHDGEAYLDRIEFSIAPESGVRAGSLASGQADAVSDVLPQDEPQIEGAGGSVLTTANPGVVFHLQPNVEDGVLADEATRRALLPAINRQEIVDTILGDDFYPATSVLAHRTPGWTDLSGTLAHDPDQARRQLEEAGWVEGGDGIRERDGEPLSIDVVFAPAFDGSQAALELVQQQLREVGVDLQLRLSTSAEATEAQETGDYITYYYNVTRADPDILRQAFSTDFRNINRRGEDPELDAVFDQQLATTDQAERDQLIAEAQELILDRAYSIPLFELSQAIGTASHVHGLAFEASARLQFYDTWLSE